MTEKGLLKLRPTFEFGRMTMVDWFEITQGAGYYTIRSGLKHAYGETKSPYFYSEYVGGKNAKKEALKKFSEWWNNKTIKKIQITL